MASWDDLRTVVADLPELVEQAPHDWRVHRRMVAWERPLRQSDLDWFADSGRPPPDDPILGVRVSDEGVKLALVSDQPDVFFTTPHFDGYAAVLIRLDAISVDDLRELVVDAWLDRAPKRLAAMYLSGEGDTSRKADGP